MEYPRIIALLILCLVVPAAWGLLVEWIFHVIRGSRRDKNTDSTETCTVGGNVEQ